MTSIYLYDKQGHLIAEQTALVDALGAAILPENATFNAPLPPREGYHVVFNGSIWEYKKLPCAEYQPPLITEKNYIEKRLASYPDIGEQLDMIFHDKENGTNFWFEKIKEIKEKYPKVNLND